MLRFGSVALLVSLLACPALADSWAEKLFSEKSHDFGSVPRAAKSEYVFKVKNPYNEEVHIASVRSSCGCTIPRIEKDTLKGGEEGAIIAEFNTRSFTGQRHARLTVTIDRPRYTEIQLDIAGYIRTDVVLNPTLVNLGTVVEGQPSDKTVKIEYAGRNDWKITGVTPSSPWLTAEVKEVSRANGRVGYELEVQLKEGAPAGYINDQIMIATNDRRATQFPVVVEGRVEAELTVSPAPLMLGTLQQGQKVTKQLIIKGATPFKIIDIYCEDDSFTFKPSADSKTVHLLPVTFEAPGYPGKVSQKIEILTDLGEHKTVELTALGQISSPLAGK